MSWAASFPVWLLLTLLSEPAGKFRPDAYVPIAVIFLVWWGLVVAAARPLSRNLTRQGVRVWPMLVGLTTVVTHVLAAGTMILVLKEVETLATPLGESFTQAILAVPGILFFVSQPVGAFAGAYVGSVWSERKADS